MYFVIIKNHNTIMCLSFINIRIKSAFHILESEITTKKSLSKSGNFADKLHNTSASRTSNIIFKHRHRRRGK